MLDRRVFAAGRRPPRILAFSDGNRGIRLRVAYAAIVAAAATAALAAPSPAGAQESRIVDSSAGPIVVERWAGPLVHPWALEFLPDGSALVTERPGRLRLISPDGTLSDPIEGVPEVDARRQGGLLDVAVPPDYAETGWIYLSYARPAAGGTNSTGVARAKLNEDRTALVDLEEIFVQEPQVASTMHYGNRILFDGEYVFVALGERSDQQFRGQSQDLDSHLGKVVRIHRDGSVPEDNPFVATEGALPEIWSYGHRNPQAAAIDPETGVFYEIEHGPRGGDEINIVEPGVNYGWPVVSHGVNYSGTPIGSGEATGPGFRDPILQWTPVIAPSGAVVYYGDEFDAWTGDLIVGGLRSLGLVRVEIDGESAREAERVPLQRRVRDVVIGPQGALYVATDHADGEILRLAPARD